MVLVPAMSGLDTGLRSGVIVESFAYAPSRYQHWGYGRSLDGGGRLRRSAVLTAPSAVASMVAKTRTLLTSFRPDLVHIHWLLPQGAAILALPRAVPVVVSMHGADAKLATRRFLRGFAARILDRADHLVAASTPILDIGRTLNPSIADRSSVIPHGANSRLFGQDRRSDVRASLSIPHDATLVLAVGRLVPKKGFDRAIESVAKLEQNFRLVIAGGGPLEDELREQAQLLANDRVHLVGSLSRSELAHWYAAADVVVIPSIPHAGDIDSGPVVLAEAMASGRPVIATAVGMAPDLIIDEVNGYLLERPDPELIADRIRRAAISADRLGTAARTAFEAMGDWTRVAAQLDEVYNLAGERRRLMAP